MKKATQLLKIIDRSGISHESIRRAIKVNKCDLSLSLNGKKNTPSGVRILNDVETHLTKVAFVLSQQLEGIK